jgi:flagellar biosynthetic protein FliQ
MSAALAVDIFRQALYTTFWISLPLLLIGMTIGVLVSLIQVVTSIQDSSFAAVPRLCAFLFGLLILLPWMTSKLMAYTIALFGDFSKYAR